MLQPNDLNSRCIGNIKCRNDGANTPQIVSVVGDDQRIVARVDIDGVVGTDQRPQNRHQIVGRLMIQAKNLRLDLACCARWCAS